MRKHVAVHHGTLSLKDITEIPVQTDSLVMYALTVIGAFIPVYIITIVVGLITGLLTDPSRLRAIAGSAWIIWIFPIVLIVRAAIVGTKIHIVVNERERVRVEYKFVRSRFGDEMPMDDLWTWLNDMKLTGRTGENRFRELSLPSGHDASDEYRQELKWMLETAGLWVDLGGKSGGSPAGGPDYAAEELGLAKLTARQLHTRRWPGRPTVKKHIEL